MTTYNFCIRGNHFVCESNKIIKHDLEAVKILKELFKIEYSDAMIEDDVAIYSDNKIKVVLKEPVKVADFLKESEYNSLVYSKTKGDVFKFLKTKEAAKVIKISIAIGVCTAILSGLYSLSKESNTVDKNVGIISGDEEIEIIDLDIPMIDGEKIHLVDEKENTLETENKNTIESLLSNEPEFIGTASEEYEDKGNIFENNTEVIITKGVDNDFTIPVENENSMIKIEGRQTGITYNYTNYTLFYDRWNNASDQRKIADEWASKGCKSDRGIATIDGRYLVAMTDTFGKAGDDVDVVLEDGTTIQCKLADVKDSRDKNCTTYGHLLQLANGEMAADIIEWEIVNSKENMDLTGWHHKKVAYVVTYSRQLEKTY